ncbi:unnamed protein product [Calypogeia fissa]
MESSPHIGNTSTLGDREGLKVGMGSIAKRPCTVLLEEKIEDNFQPTEEELLEYALWLGMNIPQDMDLIWIARDGLTQPLPEEWKPCQTEDDEIYYFNFETGESVWDHPCDGLYRKLYQEECRKLGKRPYRTRETSNWGEASTHLQASHQVNYDEMLNEKGMHSPRSPPLQDDMGVERLPSKKEIQMNIVEKEIVSLKGIRDQLLQKMNEVWQAEQFSSSASHFVVERVANISEVEQNMGSLLEGRKDEIPSLEVEHLTELNANCHGQNWSTVQLDEEEDPRKTKERTEMLRKQLELAKMIPAQLANRVGGELIHDNRQLYEDHQRCKTQINRGSPILTTNDSKVTQEGSGKHSSGSDPRNVLHRVREELKTEELVIVNEMKERILMQVRKSMEVFERSAFEEYELVLARKRENLELLHKELRQDMEFELLIEEEIILKTKREKLLARLHNQVGRENFVEQRGGIVSQRKELVTGIENRVFSPRYDELLETSRIGTSVDSISSKHETLETAIHIAPEYGFTKKNGDIRPKGKEVLYHKSVCEEDPMYEDEKNTILDLPGVSSHMRSAPKEPQKKVDVDDDLKELFLQCRRELKDDIVSLKCKMNEILVSLAKANQLNLETSSLLTVPMEDNHLASHDGTMPLDASPTQLLYNLRRIVGELDANLKHLLEEKNVDLASKNRAHMKNQQSKPLVAHNHHGVFSTDTLTILKEFLVIMSEELGENTVHLDGDETQNDKSKHILPHKGVDSEAQDLMTNYRMLVETLLLLKRLIEKIEKHIDKHIEDQTAHQEGRSNNKAPGLGFIPNKIDIPIPKQGMETQSMSLNEEISLNMSDVQSIVTQFEAISTYMISSLKGFVSQLDSEMKEKIQRHRREVKSEVNGSSKRHQESTRYGHGILIDQQTLSNSDVYSISKTFEGTSGEPKPFEKLPVDALVMLERFIGKLHYKLKDHICRRDQKAEKDIDIVQMDVPMESKPIVGHDKIILEARLQEVEQISLSDICGTSTTPNTTFRGLFAKTLCNSKGLVDGLHPGIISSIQHESNTIGDQISGFLMRSPTKDNNFLMLHKENPDIESVLPKLEMEEMRQDPTLELDKLSTKSLYAFKRFQNELAKELHNQVLRGAGKLEIDATGSTLGKMDDSCHSCPEGTTFETCDKSTSQENVKKSLDAPSTPYDMMLMGLKGFIANLDEELKAVIQDCKREWNDGNGRMRFTMNGTEHHELYSQTEENELESQSFIPMLKAWSTEIENSTQNLLQHFKSELMDILQRTKANEHSPLHYMNCDQLLPEKPQHLTQVQTLVAEGRRIWYDILNDATNQWLQKEWVERLEHQSDLTTTCDTSISPPNSESLNPVQRVVGEEKKIMHDILNHSTQKWLVQERSPLGSHLTSEAKESAQDTPESVEGNLKDEYSPCTRSQQKYCTTLNSPRERRDFEGNEINGRSLTSDTIHLEEDRQSKLFTNDLEVNVGCLPGNMNFCMIESSCSGKEDEHPCGYGVDQQAKLIHNISVNQNNLSSINHWISKAEPFGTFNYENEVRVSHEGSLCEECRKQNILIQGIANRKVQRHHGRVPVPRSMSQLKLVSKKSWQTLQSKLRAAQATTWAHMIGSWAIEKMSCGLLLKKDRGSYSTFAIKKAIKTILEKTPCSKAFHSTKFEEFEDEMERGNNEGTVGQHDSKDNMIQKYCCYPSTRPRITRSTSSQIKNRIQNISPLDLDGSHIRQNSSNMCGEVKASFSGWRKFDAISNMDEQQEVPLNDPESMTNSVIKYQSDDDLALSIVENKRFDCKTPMTNSINLREVDMHELEEAINSLRQSRELESTGKAIWVNHSHTDGDHFEDEPNDYVNATPTLQRELNNSKPFEFVNGDHEINQESSNRSIYKENKSGHMKGKVPKFITFESLQQGEIALPDMISTRTN